MKRFIANAMGVVLSCISGFAINAQEKCGTTFNLEKIRTEDPERYKRFIELERFTQSYIKAIKEKKREETGRIIDPNGTIIIPVVVHVLHKGEIEGVGFNISMARIQEQINVLNLEPV